MTVWFWDPFFHTEDNWGTHMQLLQIPGPKTNFLPHLPMAGDLIKFTGQNVFLPATKLFLQKQAFITTTMAKYIPMFLICPLLKKKKKTIYWFIFICFFWS